MEPCDEKEPFFLVCGTISPVKGFDLALQGYQIFLKKYPEYVDHKLVIAGSFIRGLESYSQQIRDFIEKNSLADQVKFVGYRKNIQAYMRKASAFIMSSRNEGFGRVTVEAMLNSCPVVGYDAGGTAELLQRGENGVLFSSPEELADSLGRLLHNSEETRAIAARAKTFADLHFSDQNYIDHLSAFYDERLSPRGGGGKA